MLTKIVSGGQTGADRAGLDAAMETDIPVGGWCPGMDGGTWHLYSEHCRPKGVKVSRHLCKGNWISSMGL